jgi:oligopeptide/dipeptide ABC transporter ATP-binding protein
MENERLLDVKNLKKHFPVTKGIVFKKQIGQIKAVDGVTFHINRGETFGLVGESGCGKTTIAKVILLMEKITSGKVTFNGRDIDQLSGQDLTDFRGMVKAVFQDPFSSLSPRMRAWEIIAEPIIANNPKPKKEMKERVAQLLELVGLPAHSVDLFPHEFSGGQRQRIAVARSLALDPKLIVLDEPVSALDVSIRAQIMNILREIQKRFGLTYLLIAHDLAVVKHMSTTIGVMYLGKLVEVSDAKKLYRQPFHPYTQALLSAAMPSHPSIQQDEIILTGEVPSPLHPPPGCRFYPRCFKAQEICAIKEPQLKDQGENHYVACHLYSTSPEYPAV